MLARLAQNGPPGNISNKEGDNDDQHRLYDDEGEEEESDQSDSDDEGNAGYGTGNVSSSPLTKKASSSFVHTVSAAAPPPAPPSLHSTSLNPTVLSPLVVSSPKPVGGAGLGEKEEGRGTGGSIVGSPAAAATATAANDDDIKRLEEDDQELLDAAIEVERGIAHALENLVSFFFSRASVGAFGLNPPFIQRLIVLIFFLPSFHGGVCFHFSTNIVELVEFGSDDTMFGSTACVLSCTS